MLVMCPSCQRQNPADARFCTGCGTPIELPCPGCGTANAGDSRFCKACGQRLSVPAAAPPAAAGRGPDSYTPAHLVERILGSRTTLEVLGRQRSSVDVNVHVWEPEEERWRLLTIAERQLLWERRR